MTLQFKAPAKLETKTETKLPATEGGWEPLNIETLPEDLQRHYNAWRKASDEAKALKAVFTAECREAIVSPKGRQFVLGWLYGKLTYSFQPITESKAKTSLVDFRSLMKK